MSKNLKLKAARTALDMTQKDLAEAIGVSRKKIVTEFSIKFNKQSVMDMMNCAPENILYEETLEEMEALEEKAYSLLETKAVIVYGEIPALAATEDIPAGTKVLFAILTVGNGMSIWSANLFAEGDYLGAMLVNAMADDVLFQMDTALKEPLIEMSKAVKMGIRKRIEAPNDIGLISQLAAWEATDAKQTIGVNILSSYMFEPVKTHCQIYILEEGCTEYKTDHDCRTCSAFQCKRRTVSPFYHCEA